MTALGRVPVCEACLESTPARLESALAQTASLCDRCGDDLEFESLRFASSLGVSACTACRLAPPEFTRAVAYSSYDDRMRDLLHLFKFEAQRDLARAALGAWLAQAVYRLRPQTAAELVVVPVPLFAARERERGFNQAALLAREALRRLRNMDREWKLDYQPGALRRVKNTRPLFALDPAGRRRSLKGAFRIGDASAVRGREVLLVDDIMTTGATARECARVLLRAGATRVWVATVAKAQPDRLRVIEDSTDSTEEEQASGVARWDATPAASGTESHLNT
jgi:ComF family protein